MPYVFVHLPGETTAVPAGLVTLFEQGIQLQASRFAYGRRYRDRNAPAAIAVDPVSLPLADAAGDQVPINGLPLFGALRDATPDDWGRRVIENRLGVPANGLPESQYLLLAGSNRVGALDVRPALDSTPDTAGMPAAIDLQYLVAAAERVEQGLPVPKALENYLVGAPSLGGARPKATIAHDAREWIAKFPSVRDRFDVPSVERATLELARRAGLSVPETALQTLADGRHVMLIERFDRRPVAGGMGRRHTVSALTMLGLSEQQSPDARYAQIVRVIEDRATDGQVAAQREELFARMVFNILVSNDDDHLRNHAFVHDDGAWNLSPLYDVVPKPQVGSERTLHLGVGPRGRWATLDNALAGHGDFGLNQQRAARLIDRVAAAVRVWREVFEELGVSEKDCTLVKTAFRRAADVGMREVERHL
ncbi:type II toxin-antitoxin system HipA family toxin [Xanthomonas sp. NCPPB 1638]|uniref:type II toxin-antitoxin system HipA family toxin n=1 Tax=Xanthomonas TaxID=338 RepID=UPI00132F39A3|nr:type II toxin-antitoxin system HipA family toxin [Xanthomonas cucurbitae]QHG88699.1 type II toxin-antitoxin system HipA family toxin [Xanthomonas cucurbitae]WDM75289.1 type II toxin-antitoxin system HipA family toxin [Xanthomonas cucurbitae]